MSKIEVEVDDMLAEEVKKLEKENKKLKTQNNNLKEKIEALEKELEKWGEASRLINNLVYDLTNAGFYVDDCGC